MLTAPKLEPFAAATQCPKCGDGTQASDRPLPLPELPVPVFLRSADTMRTQYCAGGKEAQDELQHPLATIFQSVGGPNPPGLEHLAEQMAQRKINLCAGIGEEHLHKTCSRCGFEFLMRCKDAPTA